jgi:hypothetical protein
VGQLNAQQDGVSNMAPTSTWVYTLATGIFTRGGFYDPTYDAATEGVVMFPDADPHPDVRLDRFDTETGKRPATDEEIAAYDAAAFDAAALTAATSDPTRTALGLALYAAILQRSPTEAEQLALLDLAKTFYKGLTTTAPFPTTMIAATSDVLATAPSR